MDELGAFVDHVEAFASGGRCEEQNLVTACCKCNGRKTSAPLPAWDQRDKRSPIKGKCGEPQQWDDLSGLFVVFGWITSRSTYIWDKEWLMALVGKTEAKTYPSESNHAKLRSLAANTS